MSMELDALLAPDVDRIEIDLTTAQLMSMSRDELNVYEALFRAASDRGLWVTHWRDPASYVTHYVISLKPPSS